MMISPKKVLFGLLLLSFNAYSSIIVTEDSYTTGNYGITHTVGLQNEAYAPYQVGWRATLLTTTEKNAASAGGYNFLGNDDNIEEINGDIDEIDEFFGDVLLSRSWGVGDEDNGESTASTSSEFTRNYSITLSSVYAPTIPITFEYVLAASASTSKNSNFAQANATASIGIGLFSDSVSVQNYSFRDDRARETKTGKVTININPRSIFSVRLQTSTFGRAYGSGAFGYGQAIADPLVYIDPSYEFADAFQISLLDNDTPFSVSDGTPFDLEPPASSVSEPPAFAIFILGAFGLMMRRLKHRP
ncbi:hypothetical protein SG34_030260 [Thalassomonas viridans]|uniref:PEP-CTERM protein-sorting domain-containing protein n=1 Tax=Thalassomonas viridans TaxID=137584 RepID=A0AAF0CDU9_9GAMM|nr:hypothetical protein [Thalassomonas viridans]WDE09061.1 hypothetical protein SG34_030260 [Thalassomonas viridans]